MLNYLEKLISPGWKLQQVCKDFISSRRGYLKNEISMFKIIYVNRSSLSLTLKILDPVHAYTLFLNNFGKFRLLPPNFVR